MLPIALLIIAGALALIGLVVLLRALRGDPARGRLRCPKCWYDMRGSPGTVCPECGHDAREARLLLGTRRRWRIVALGLLLMLAALYPKTVAHRIRHDRESAKVAAVPTTLLAVAYPYVDRATCDLIRDRFWRGTPRGSSAWGWQRAILIMQIQRRIDRMADEVASIEEQNDMIRMSAVSDAALQHVRAIAALPSSPAASIALERLRQAVREPQHADVVDDFLRWSNDPAHPFFATARLILSEIPTDTLNRLSDKQLADVIRIVGRMPYDTRAEHVLSAVEGRTTHVDAALTELLRSYGSDLPRSRRWTIVRTAQCRLRHQPLPVVVKFVKQPPHEAKRGALPTLDVEMVNQEDDLYGPILIQEADASAEQRDGRSGRWRISLRSKDGLEVPRLNGHATDSVAKAGPLDPEHPLPARFDLNRYVDPQPGTYTLVVQYHDQLRIANMPAVPGLILFESAPVELVVTP